MLLHTQFAILATSRQCGREIQQLHLPLHKLKIGTYVTAQPGAERPEGCNPFHPISTATMDTTVFDVVHMFSERGISAVPIIDEDGIVVNLYETVDVIVSLTLPSRCSMYTGQNGAKLSCGRLSSGSAPTSR